ncbi:MAG TPA: ROK family protein [Gemmataceae bacterium]|nr:ROK family protein [Gemmataceae bacterium]
MPAHSSLSTHHSSLFFVGLDVGGSTMKAGVVDDAGRPLSAVSLPTEPEKGQEHGLKRMCETIREAVAAAKLRLDQIAAIGVATPGTMDIPAGIILDPPNLKPWLNVPVRQTVYDEFRVPTAFQNDANAAAYGEFWVGAGRDAHSMVLFTLGTGIGCGIIIGDMIVEGEHSHGAEVGHMRIELTNPRQCGCGRWGCLEAYASATAVVKRAHDALAQDGGKSSLHRTLKERGRITSEDIFNAAAAGDAVSDKLVEDTAFYLAVGATNMMHTIDPDMVVYAGGMIAAGEPFLDRIRRHVKQLAFPVPAEKTQIRYAQLGGDAGFIGAAACGRQLFYKSPTAPPRSASR